MANPITVFKPLSSDDTFKGSTKTYSTFKTASGDTTNPGDTYLSWYMVERGTADWSIATDELKNLFHSFGIARSDEEEWWKAFGTLTDYYNAKRMIIAVMPESECGSYIDGSTLRMAVPTDTAGNFFYLYGSTFNGSPYVNSQGVTYIAANEYDNSVYGCASCYLFGNTVGTGNVGSYITDGEHPYTGQVDGGANPNVDATSWDHFQVDTTDPHIAATHWSHGDDGRDTPLGIAFLEKGIFIIFDMYGRDDLIADIPGLYDGAQVWTANTSNIRAYNTTTGVLNTDQTVRQEISFSGAYAPSRASVTYRTVTHDYKMIYFCHAGQNEFNSTANHTYNHARAYYRPEEADSIWITEIALYDEDDIPLAYAKLSEPVEKSKLDTLTFKVSLNL